MTHDDTDGFLVFPARATAPHRGISSYITSEFVNLITKKNGQKIKSFIFVISYI